MTTRFDQAIERICDRTFNDAIAPGGWLREQIRKHVRWHMQGFERGYGLKEREAFTKTVAERIHDKSRQRLVVFGVRLWTIRHPEEWCAEQAEEVVSNWLADERIKFGDRRFDWTDGRDIADSEMSYWEAA